MSHYSFETIELFREVMARLSRERAASHLSTGDPQPVEISTYTIELRFNHLADASDRQFFNSVPTRLRLPASTVDRLKHLAAVELRGNPEYRKLIQDLGRADEATITNHSSTEAARSAFLYPQASESMERQ